MNLKERAVANGAHSHTAYCWFRDGALPVPAQRVGPRTILVEHRDRLGRVNTELIEAALSAAGRRLVFRARKALEAAAGD